ERARGGKQAKSYTEGTSGKASTAGEAQDTSSLAIVTRGADGEHKVETLPKGMRVLTQGIMKRNVEKNPI
ncbi:hypothetical protein KIPB_016891, partial [Kipferlia bialata]